MRITPLDARKQEFSKSMRGFDCDEVRAFLSTLADEYETVLIDNKQIRERIMEQDEKIHEYRGLERTLRDTLMTAERVTQETRDNAGRQGELIIQEAQFKAKSIMEECRVRTEELRREIVGLRKEKESYLARFRSLAEAQIRFVDTHESDFEELDRRLVDIVDSVVTGATDRHAAAVQRQPGPVAAPKAPVRVDAGAPEVAPAPPAAPARGENDIWRDYKPGTGGPAVDDTAGTIAALVTESLAETNDYATDPLSIKTEAEAEAEIAIEPLTIDVISRGPAEPAPGAAWRPEVATESINI
jgi:cell division initiation protein